MEQATENSGNVDASAPAQTTALPAKKQPRRIIRRRRNQPVPPPAVDPVLLKQVLQESGLPADAYSFEIVKTIERIKSLDAAHIALQMPEGLLLYATVIADVLLRLTPVLEQVSILGDVTYGACCVDDLNAQALGAQLLVHYGHSCLVPLQHTVIPCLYVFVEIQWNVQHMVQSLDMTIKQQQQQQQSSSGSSSSSSDDLQTRIQGDVVIYLLGTVQFRHLLVLARKMLQDEYNYQHVTIPQVKPLSPGEVLGCTSPILSSDNDDSTTSYVCFIADGRFHLESTLISNPHITNFYRYDPYSQSLTRESYKHDHMHALRTHAINQAKSANKFGIILGTLGRQGNPAILKRLQDTLRKKYHKQTFIMLLSEITPQKLQLFAKSIDAWVQIACPRLSVDWGHCLSLSNKPVLSPYEVMVSLGETEYREAYPMDYYSSTGGPWSNYYDENKSRKVCCKGDNNSDKCEEKQQQ